MYNHESPSLVMFKVIWTHFTFLWLILKVWFHPQMNISLKYFQPQAIQDVDKFVSSSKHTWSTRSPLDPLQWMSTVRMRVQIADKNITIIIHKLNVCNKQINHYGLQKQKQSKSYLWIIMMFLWAVWTLILTAPIHSRGFIGDQVI